MTKPKSGKSKPGSKTVRERLDELKASNPQIDFSAIDGWPAGGWESPIDMDRFGRLMDEWVKNPELRELSLPVVKYALKSALSANSSNAAKNPRVRGPRYLDEINRWRKEAYIALARNQNLTTTEIADAIKTFGTMASVRYLRDWVRKNEVELRRKGAETAAKSLEKPRE